MSRPRISEITPDPARDYAKDIGTAKTLTALRRVLRDWRDVAPDALAVAVRMQEQDFPDWLEGLAKERRGEFAGERWAEVYGAILMPERMLRASVLADEYKVPWGLAFMRVKEIEAAK